VLYIPNVVYYIKSDAALEIANDLNVFYQLLGMLKIFPKKIRDLVYDYIAKNRYKWFGKTENCMMPTPEIQSKFLL
jgi:predicted DCC family thiol-disulfide oxidoreductase YuxK